MFLEERYAALGAEGQLKITAKGRTAATYAADGAVVLRSAYPGDDVAVLTLRTVSSRWGQLLEDPESCTNTEEPAIWLRLALGGGVSAVLTLCPTF